MKCYLTILPCITPVEAILVDSCDRGVAGSMEEALLVVLVTVSHLHVQLFNLKALPQTGILNPVDLRVQNLTLLFIAVMSLIASSLVLTVDIN